MGIAIGIISSMYHTQSLKLEWARAIRIVGTGGGKTSELYHRLPMPHLVFGVKNVDSPGKTPSRHRELRRILKTAYKFDLYAYDSTFQ